VRGFGDDSSAFVPDERSVESRSSPRPLWLGVAGARQIEPAIGPPQPASLENGQPPSGRPPRTPHFLFGLSKHGGRSVLQPVIEPARRRAALADGVAERALFAGFVVRGRPPLVIAQWTLAGP